MRTLSASALSAARKMLTERLDKLNEDVAEPKFLREITDCMLDIVEHQIDRKLTSRELLEPPER